MKTEIKIDNMQKIGIFMSASHLNVLVYLKSGDYRIVSRSPSSIFSDHLTTELNYKNLFPVQT